MKKGTFSEETTYDGYLSWLSTAIKTVGYCEYLTLSWWLSGGVRGHGEIMEGGGSVSDL